MSQVSFNFIALDSDGTKRRGRLRAADRRDAYRQVLATGLQPVKLTSGQSRFRRRGGVGIRELSHFTLQLATLMQARIPIADGIRSIVEQESNDALRGVMEDIAERIESGISVTEAIAPHRAIFGDVYIETLHAAEVSGNLIGVLNELAEMLDRQYETRKNVTGAMMYPACVLGVMALAVGFLVVLVVPKFADLFARREVELPMATQALILLSESVTGYWYIWIAAIVATVFGLRAVRRSPLWCARADAVLHRVPKVRNLLEGLAVSRFARVLGLCIQSGMSLVDALELAGRASGRPLLQKDAGTMGDQVRQGGSLTDALDRCGYLPPFARRMITAGEEAAELSKMCGLVSAHYNREVTHIARNLSTILEPVMILLLAAVVLFIAMAIFLPMWNMASLAG